MITDHARWRGLASLVLAAGLLSGCNVTPSAVPGPPSLSPDQSTTAAPVAPLQPATLPPPPPANGGGHSNGGGADTRRPAQTLPPDWPTEIPLPPGLLEGSTGGSPRWSVMLLVGGGADEALTSATGFYTSHGFTSDGIAQLHRSGYQVVMVAANRDHTPTQTNLTISVIKD